MPRLNGEYQIVVSSQYELSVPAEWMPLFAGPTVVLCWADTHWKLYYPGEFFAWHLVTDNDHELSGHPIPDDIQRQIKSACTVPLTPEGMFTIPPSLRLKPPGAVAMLGVTNHIEIWPLEAWRAHMSEQIDQAAKSAAELLD